MTDIQFIGAVIFIAALSIFAIIKRKQIDFQKWPKIKVPIFYTAMYRTKLGLRLMDWLANLSPRFWRITGTVGIWVGFIAMFFISGYMIYAFIKAIMALFAPRIPSAIGEGVTLVLPFKIKGTFYVPFSYWVISIFIIAVIHEMAHGIVARAYNMKIKSSGFAFFGIIAPLVPAAFVEPNEKEIDKRPKKEQMAVFAAGSFANILLAAFVLIILMPLMTPLSDRVIEYNGVLVDGLLSDKYGPNPTKEIGIVIGDRIIAIDGIKISTVDDFTKILLDKKPHEPVMVTKISISGETSSDIMELGHHLSDPSKAYFGITAAQSSDIKPWAKDKYGIFAYPILWFNKLLFWIFALSFGIGLFNLLPLGPIDGGRMFKSAMQKIFNKESHADTAWTAVSYLFIIMILGGLILSFVK